MNFGRKRMRWVRNRPKFGEGKAEMAGFLAPSVAAGLLGNVTPVDEDDCSDLPRCSPEPAPGPVHTVRS